MEPEFRELTADELEFVESSGRVGRQVCDHYLSEQVLVSPDSLDDVYEAWASDAESEKPTPEEICYGLGALLGNCIVSQLGYSWGMAIDQFGTDYAVRHPDSWRSFPFDFVAKRVNDGEPQGGFFRALYDQLEKRNPA